MRILRVAQKCYPNVKGGGAYHVHALSRDQAAHGHDVTVLTVRRGDRPRLETRDGYTVIRRRATASPLGNEISLGLARELWNANNYDVVHAHSHLYVATNLAALRRRVDDKPLAITNHGLRSQSAPGWAFERYLRTVGRRTLDAADVVFTYTDAERAELRDLGVRTDVAVVPNGIDVERFTPEGPERDLITGGPTALFVGRLVEGKRPGDALAAVGDLVADHPDLRLVIAGEGPLRGTLEQRVAEQDLAEHVSFLGHVDYDDMPALYRAADLLVLPSAAEGLPRTMLEALATGTPVVATALAQLKSLLHHGGVAVPVGHVDALAGDMEELLFDPERRARLGEAGRSYVAERHSWAETVQLTTERLTALVE